MSLKSAFCISLLWLTCLTIYGQKLGEVTKAHKFVIIGKVEGLTDSTILYLFNFNTAKAIDSALVQDGQFWLRGQFTEPEQFSVSTKYVYQNYHSTGYFWIDGDTIHLTGTLKKLEQAIIKGSKMENESRQYKELLIPIQHQRDSLSSVKRRLQYKDSLARAAVENGFIKLDEAIRSTQVKFIKQHPNSYVGVEFLRLFALTRELPKSTIQTLYSGLSGELQKSTIGQHIQEYLQLSQDIQIGDTFTDFTQVDLAGRTVKFSAFKGKYTLLEFWSSGCVPCRAENPQMVELYKQYHAQGLEIVGISLDEDRERWKRAIEQDQLPWPQLSDLKGAFNKGALIYDVAGLPTNFLIDSTGKIIGRDLRRDKLKSKLVGIFNK
ncbi:redoxin domain-containing protein [Spirosoma aerophilum]